MDPMANYNAYFAQPSSPHGGVPAMAPANGGGVQMHVGGAPPAAMMPPQVAPVNAGPQINSREALVQFVRETVAAQTAGVAEQVVQHILDPQGPLAQALGNVAERLAALEAGAAYARDPFAVFTREEQRVLHLLREQVIDKSEARVRFPAEANGSAAPCNMPVEAGQQPPALTAPSAPAKRHRRTKAEIEAAKAAATPQATTNAVPADVVDVAALFTDTAATEE